MTLRIKMQLGCTVEPAQAEALRALSASTEIPITDLLRLGVELALAQAQRDEEVSEERKATSVEMERAMALVGSIHDYLIEKPDPVAIGQTYIRDDYWDADDGGTLYRDASRVRDWFDRLAAALHAAEDRLRETEDAAAT